MVSPAVMAHRRAKAREATAPASARQGALAVIEPERDVPGIGRNPAKRDTRPNRPLTMARSAYRSGAHGVEAGQLSIR